MQILKNRRRLVILALVGIGLFSMVALWWQCAVNPRVPFLVHTGPAEWIVYPKPPDAQPGFVVEMHAVFHRSFELDRAPETAALSVRAFTRCAIAVNGTVISDTNQTIANWKKPAEYQISKALRAGSNDLSVTVYNANGPPALWLSLNVGVLKLNTDRAWDVSLAGAVWRKARLASQPMEIKNGNTLYGGASVSDSLRHVFPALLLFAACAAAATLAGWWCVKWYRKRGQPLGPLDSSSFAIVLVAIVAVFWAALFLNNIRLLPNIIGFDSDGHLAYIDYIHTHPALPLASDGWEMFQAPLYYMTASMLTSPTLPVSLNDGAIRALRLMGLLVSIANIALVLFSLRLLFPGRLGQQFFGLLLAACLPGHLYISQYISNESMAAAWVTATIYFTLRLIKQDNESRGLSLAVGVCLGAALLTKVTALLAVPFVGGALFGWLWIKQRGSAVAWARTFGIILLSCFAVCGWHYLRVWRNFGTPFVNVWDKASGIAWWADPGFHTAAYFTRFGQCLVHPFYSVTNGFFDGIYSTLWADGVYGGMPVFDGRPPWNDGLMAVGCLLALLPSVLILAGLAVSLWRFFRKPEPGWFLLLGLTFATCAALISMNLKLPYFCVVKAFYGLIALVPLCAFGAVGWEILGTRMRRLRPMLCVALGLWALTSYASFWIRDGNSYAHVLLGNHLAGENRHTEAIAEYNKALQLDPRNTRAAEALATEELNQHQFDDAQKQMEQALAEHPDDAQAHLQLGVVFADKEQPDAAVREAKHAVELAPDFGLAYDARCKWLVQLGKYQEASTVGREGLRITPANAELHYSLGRALAGSGSYSEAVNHFHLACMLKTNWPDAFDQWGTSLASLGRWDEAGAKIQQACRMKPQSPDFHYHMALVWQNQGRTSDAVSEYENALQLDADYLPVLNNLAWLLATDANSQVRDGKRAVELAGHACDLTGNRATLFLGTLAAAYAESGDFANAVSSAEKAIALAQAAGDAQLIQNNQGLLDLYRKNQPYHQKVSSPSGPKS